MILRCLMLAAALGLVLPVAASAPGLPPVRIYNQDNGLPQNTILHLGRDPQGRIWIGTQDGAAVYNGNWWVTHHMPNATRSNIVDAVLATEDGALWFGRRDEGIARLAGGTWTAFGQAEGLPKGRVTSLLETRGADGRSRIWATVLDAGLLRLEGDRWSPAPENASLPSLRPWRLVPVLGQPEAFWIATEAGLCKWEGGRILPVPGVPKANYNCLLESRTREGGLCLWLGTYGDGLYRVAGGEVTRFGLKDGMPSTFVTDLAETRDPEGRTSIWVATLAGVARLQGGAWQVFGSAEGVPGGTVYRLLAEPSPSGPLDLWVGTSGGGLARLSFGRWSSHDKRVGVPEERVWSVRESGQGAWRGDLWIGVTGGLLRWHGGQWIKQAPPDRIMAILETRVEGRPRLWVGGARGLWVLDRERWRQIQPKEGFPGSRVNALLETQDAEGTPSLWVATERAGLYRLTAGAWQAYPVPAGNAQAQYLETLCETRDAKGHPTLWVGSRAGLYRLSGGRLEEVRPQGGLPNETINTMTPYPAGGTPTHLLLGTFGGGLLQLDLADPTRPVAPFPPQGSGLLPSGVIQDLTWDGQGNLFVFTVKGATRLSPSLGGGWQAVHFNREDGLPAEQTTIKGACTGLDGRIWIATASGLASVDPRGTQVVTNPRPLLLEGLLADGVSHSLATPPILAPGTGRVVVQFALLSFFRESETRYRTQLMEHEPEPGPWEKGASREFNRLSPGTYHLKIWARDHAGAVSGPREAVFEMLPAWWQTLWFRSLGLAGLLGLLWLVVRWRTRAVERHRRELELEVGQRTRELAEANAVLVQEIQVRQAAERTKDEFVAVVSHELRTPLTSIHGALGLVRSGALGGLPEQPKALLDLAHRNSLRLQALVNDLLDMQKIEAGMLTLSPVSMDLGQLVTRAVESMGGYAQETGVSIQWMPPEGRAPVEGDPARLEQVLTNLLSNACKHSPEGGQVEVGLHLRDGWARVDVANHGAPIPPTFRDAIFQKFAQADASTTRSRGGTGLGLAICKAIVEHLRGHIGYESDAQRTVFWFELPLSATRT